MNRLVALFLFYFGILLSSYAGISASYKDSIDIESLKRKMVEIQSVSNELKPKAQELINLFEGYKVKAKTRKCSDALKEALDGLDMAQKASKDCDDVNRIAAKVIKAKKPEDVKKLTLEADRKVKNAKYFILQADDRKKETEFEMKGCD
jgi:hypothetical protein